MPPRPSGWDSEQLSSPANVQEAARSHAATHGRGTSRWLAQEHGVSQRTAQRWLAGSQQPRNRETRNALMAAADRQRVRVDALRQVRAVDLGTVEVWERSPNMRSTRNLGYLTVDMNPVADLLEAGGTDGDADELAARIFEAAYFGASMDDDLPLEITDYGDIEYY